MTLPDNAGLPAETPERGNPLRRSRRLLWAFVLVQALILAAIGFRSGTLSLPAPPPIDSTASLWLIFLTGLTAGGLSCLAVQGGLLATLVARREQERLEAAVSRQGHALAILQFLGAKLVAYTLLGALLGSVGSWIALSPAMRGWLQVGIGLYMLGVALQMLDVHPIFRYLTLQPPKRVQRLIRANAKRGDALAPLSLGALTVLIPCGVTQAMELLALGSGSPARGALILFAFVLGTSPLFFILGLLTARLSGAWQGTFLRVAAVAIAVMALYSMLGGSRLLGYTFGLEAPASASVPSASEPTPRPILPAILSEFEPQPSGPPAITDGVQSVTVKALDFGYEPARVTLRAGIPARLTLVTDQNYSCTRAFVIPSLNVSRMLPESGRDTIAFTPEAPGEIAFTCSMGMYSGVIEVIPDDETVSASSPAAVPTAEPAPPAPTPAPATAAPVAEGEVQAVTIAARDWGYEPTQVQVHAGKPVRLTLVTEQNFSCSRSFLIPAFNIELFLPETGSETVEFTPTEIGPIGFTCGMGMYSGVIEVLPGDAVLTQTGLAPTPTPAPLANPDAPGGKPSADAGRILYMAPVGPALQVFVAHADGSATRQLTNDVNGATYPSLAPDGSRVAYVSTRDGRPDIYIDLLNGRDVQRVSSGNDANLQPVFSPDGTRIAFVAVRDGESNLWLMNADGSEPRLLLDRPGNEFLGGWSPDSETIVFAAEQEASLSLWKVAVDGGDPEPLSDGRGMDSAPAFSPDGQRIVFQSGRAGNGQQIFTMANDGSDVRQLTGNAQDSLLPIFSPDGQWIVYGSVRGEQVTLEVIPSAGGRPTVLSDTFGGLPSGWIAGTLKTQGP